MNNVHSVNIEALGSALYFVGSSASLMSSKIQEVAGRVINNLPPAIDGLSLFRNGLSGFSKLYDRVVFGESIAQKSPKIAMLINKVVGCGTLLGGVLGVFVGANITRKAGLNLMNDYEKGDIEGAKDHVGMAFIGGSYAILSSAMVVAESAVIASAMKVAAVATHVILAASFAMSLFVAIPAVRSLYLQKQFMNEFNRVAIVDNKDLGAIIKFLQGKGERLASLSSEQCKEHVGNLATKLETLTPDKQKEIKDLLIREVTLANKKQQTTQYLLLAAAFVGALATAAGLLLTGPVAPLLFALGAVLWLSIDSMWVQEKLFNKLHGKENFDEIEEKLNPAL